jgi:LysR family hydrogen peroxide-inducible transcriptional activator
LLEFARKILTDAADARSCLDELRQEAAGILRVGVIPTIAPYLLRPLLTEFRKRYPLVDVRIAEEVTDNLLRAVEDGEVDLTVISTCRNSSSTARQLIGREPLLAALPCSHRLAGNRSIPPAAIAQETFVMLHETHCLSRQIVRWCKQHGVSPQNTLSAVQLSTVLAMIAAGQGVSIVPAMAVAHEHGRGCVFVPFRGSAPEREINLIRNRARHTTKAAAAFSAVLQETLNALQDTSE